MKIEAELGSDGVSIYVERNYVGIISAGTKVTEVKSYDKDKSYIKRVTKLKEAGFTADEILDLIGDGK